MDSGTSTTDPGEPGDGGDASSAAGLPSSPLVGEMTITKSDLAKLMGAVEAAIMLYNELEHDALPDISINTHDKWLALGIALDKLEVPKDE